MHAIEEDGPSQVFEPEVWSPEEPTRRGSILRKSSVEEDDDGFADFGSEASESPGSRGGHSRGSPSRNRASSSRSSVAGHKRRSSVKPYIDPSILARRNICKTRQLGQDVSTSDLSYELMICSGLLIDFIWRQRHKVRIEDPFESIQVVLSKQAWSNLRTYRFCYIQVCRESLRYQLMESITTEFKSKGQFLPVAKGTWKVWGDYIRKHNRDVTCLFTQVDIKVKLRRLLHITEHRETEDTADKKGRLEEFWSAYHDRSRIVNNKPKKSESKALRPQYGMTWDLRTGPQWRIITPMPGTLKYQQLPAREKANGFDIKTGVGFRSSLSSSLPQLTPPDSPGGSRPTTAERLSPLQTRHTYLQACDKKGKVIAPIPTHFMTGHSKIFSARGRKMVDKELVSVVQMLKDVPTLEEVDLFDNSLLTDTGLAQFLKALVSKECLLEHLRRVDLGRCSLASRRTIDSTAVLLKDCLALRTLNLNKIQVGLKQQLLLAEAIGSHKNLQSANLSEIGLIPGHTTKEVITKLLRSTALRTLDLSWNTFDGEAFDVLGACLIRNGLLTTLRLANCSTNTSMGPAQDFIPPLQLFLEQLAGQCRGLTTLDISLNRVDFRTALILEDCLDKHKTLRNLILDSNPLGVVGLRSVLRLLCREHTALKSYSAYQCNANMPGDLQIASVPIPVFTYTNPGGKYSLQLWRPYHRAVLRMLYKTMDQNDMQPNEAFDKVVYTDKFVTKTYTHPTKDCFGAYVLPTEGELSLVFCVEKVIFKRFLSGGKNSLSETDNVGFMKLYFQNMRFQPASGKTVPLFTAWAELQGDQMAQQVFVDALSKDFSLTLPMLAHMCESVREAANDCLYKLRPAAPLDMASRFMTNKFFHRLEDLLFTYQKLDNFLSLNLANPTGHYKLELGNPSDYAVAERLLLLDRWEAAVDRKLERKDVSQYGNGSHLRSPMYQGRDLDYQMYNSVAEWKLPEDGTFEVHYTSNARAPANANVLSDELWDRLMMQMVNSGCLPTDRVAAMRTISDSFFLRSSHMRSILGYFQNVEDRAEIFIVFYLRIVDLYNAKMFRVRFPTKEEVTVLQERLGYASFFPFFQPENAKFELDLSIHDQRLCASMWVNLCLKEKFPQNLRDYSYTRADGTEDKMPLGIPRSWGSFDAVPKDGKFRATYMCAPEFRNMTARKDLGKEYGFLYGVEDLKDDDVQWWTGLTEVPNDVIVLLEFFVSRYDNIKSPFTDIDGEGGNGVITLMELSEGLDAMNFKKFDKKKKDPPDQKPKAKRIDDVFRYLDPGGEGSVSEEEWGVLGQLWKEFEYSVQEFVYFLVLKLGGDLFYAWESMLVEFGDEDKEEINYEEFAQAVERIGYFGPSNVVFRLLDVSDDGNISFDEFEVLQKYLPADKRRASVALSKPTSRGCPKYRPPSEEDPLGLSLPGVRPGTTSRPNTKGSDMSNKRSQLEDWLGTTL